MTGLGQDLDVAGIRRVVVLVEHDDATVTGWEVILPTVVTWSYTGMHDVHGTTGEMIVRGVFHRKSRNYQLTPDEAAMAKLYELIKFQDRRIIELEALLGNGSSEP